MLQTAGDRGVENESAYRLSCPGVIVGDGEVIGRSRTPPSRVAATSPLLRCWHRATPVNLPQSSLLIVRAEHLVSTAQNFNFIQKHLDGGCQLEVVAGKQPLATPTGASFQ